MAIRNEPDKEMMVYLQFLLNHARQCDLPRCASCSKLHGICRQAALRVFAVKNHPRTKNPTDGSRLRTALG